MMTGKLREEMVELLLAPWRSSPRATGLEGTLVAALELYDHFPLDVAVTGGTQEANSQLARALCGLGNEEEQEEEEEKSEDEEASDDDEIEISGTLTKVFEREEKGQVKESEQDDNKRDDPPTDNQPIVPNSLMVLHPKIPNIRIWTIPSLDGQNHPIEHFDVLVVLTSVQHQDNLPGPIMELRDRDQPLFLVRAEQEWDLIQEKLTGPCKTCAWERMRARQMEIERKRLAATAGEAEVPEDVKQTLLELREIGATMTTALPELRKKAFCQFMVDVFRENRVPKLLRNDEQSLLSAGLRMDKLRPGDIDRNGHLFQSRDLTNPPSRLLSALTALEHLRLDLGVLGQTGCGSSSLVNSLLGLKNQDERASPTGVTETTMEALGFPHPELPNVWLWDLPGMGRVGDLAPSSTKTDQKALSSSPQPPSPFPPMSLTPLHPLCDVYILVSPLRLSQVCVQLLQSLSAQGRMCFLVLSKADLMGEGAVEEVRRWSEEALGRLGLKHTTFLVSALHPGELDFPRLQELLCSALASHRKAALVHYVVELLESEVWGGKDQADPCKLQ
ncbi:uncharacterized protein zmp:0000000951 [Salmo salar]|uniref:Uncharacterized protein zmp:0000000951 n=1 Tax=Salmo salar TaxID=8030 RepID=A0A1S3NBL5_SALSA|nr:uncharacterized protein zmp:0000000951 [Salmo salar]|eukprot:XP_014012853.1 PREDICTED: uncharacterized protein LOC106578502 [Salmo salar]